MVVVGTGSSSRVPILRHVNYDVWVAVGQRIVEVGAVRRDVLGCGTMDECRVESSPARCRFTLLARYRSALLARGLFAPEKRHEHPYDEHYPHKRYSAKPNDQYPGRYSPPASVFPVLDPFRVRG